MRAEDSKPRRAQGVAIVVFNIDAVGGMERQAARLAERLAARGLQVTIVSTFMTEGLGIPLPRSPKCHEIRRGVEIIRVPFFRWWTSAAGTQLLDTIAAYVLRRRHRKLDAIYAVQYTAAYHGVRAGRVAGLPVACKFACSGEHGDFTVMKKEPEAPKYEAALAAVDRYVCIAGGVRDEALALGLAPERVVMLTNGVDLAHYSRPLDPAPLPELGPAEGRQLVLFVGRHDHQKRVDVLLRAFARIAPKLPRSRLACAGQGPLRPQLEALARELGIADRVAFLGVRPDVDALHRAASVFVLPSASEGLPNALLEALASGTPSIATDIPGTNEVARHEQEALLVPVGDVDGLAHALERVLTDRELAARLVAAGRKRVAEHYDIEAVADRYVTLFSEMAPARPRHDQVSAPLRFIALVVELVYLVFLAAMRAGITKGVVTVKRRLGIEGDILPRRRPAPA